MLGGWNRLLVVLALLTGAAPASAATFRVDSTADSPSANPGDGKCVSKAGGCTLRAAVEEANAAALGATIEIPAGTYELTIPPAGANYAQSGSLFLNGDVTLRGEDFTDTIVDGGGLDRVFQIEQDATVEISGLTIRNGLAKGGNGGGVLNRGNLTMSGVLFQKNRATTDPGQSEGRGGALHNSASARLREVTFDQNQADGRGGAIYNDERGRIEMTNGRLTSNRSLTDDGGAVLNAGTMSLALLPIRSNEAANGGGIDNVGGSLDLLDVLIADNAAGSDGGGLRNSGTAKLTNVTVGANRAGVSGGGIDNRADGTLAMNNVTVAHNQAGAQSEGTGGGIRTGGRGTVDLSNTIVALNTSGKAESDCAGVVRSGGYNLIGSQAGCTITGEVEGNQIDESPGLEALAPNGGEAPSYGLTADSAAVDAGSPAEPDGSGGSCAPADQRGVKRPQASRPGSPARCDIGAFERKPGA